MGVNSGLYKMFLVLHILSVVAGFGAVLLNGVYAARARQRPPAEGLAVMEVNSFVAMKVGKVFIYATFILGFALVGMSDEVIQFSDTWIWLSVTLFVVSAGVSELVLGPRVNRMLDLQREMVATPAGAVGDGPPPQAARLAAMGSQIGAISGFLHLTFFIILCLMVWKP
jgi:uncharacterized membrane protein